MRRNRRSPCGRWNIHCPQGLWLCRLFGRCFLFLSFFPFCLPLLVLPLALFRFKESRNRRIKGVNDCFYADKEQHYVADSLTVPFVLEAFQHYDEGLTMSEIAAALNQHGLKNKRGGDIDIDSVSRMLSNRKYIGEYGVGFRYPATYIFSREKPNRSRRVTYTPFLIFSSVYRSFGKYKTRQSSIGLPRLSQIARADTESPKSQEDNISFILFYKLLTRIFLTRGGVDFGSKRQIIRKNQK